LCLRLIPNLAVAWLYHPCRGTSFCATRSPVPFSRVSQRLAPIDLALDIIGSPIRVVEKLKRFSLLKTNNKKRRAAGQNPLALKSLRRILFIHAKPSSPSFAGITSPCAPIPNFIQPQGRCSFRTMLRFFAFSPVSRLVVL
jgi:hypothetical protein